jgi:hypothetical protein
MKEVRIVCAAVMSGIVIVLGPRHFDGTMIQQINQLDGTCDSIDWKRAAQGFIDSKGRFRSRTEAWKIAHAAGQIIRRVSGDQANGGTLFSENLY